MDEAVPVQAAETHELGALEAGNRAEHAALLAVRHLRLEPDERVERRAAVVLAELDDGVRPLAAARIDQPDRAHRTERERVAATSGDLLDRHAALEVDRALEVPRRHLLRLQNVGDEALVAFA